MNSQLLYNTILDNYNQGIKTSYYIYNTSKHEKMHLVRNIAETLNSWYDEYGKDGFRYYGNKIVLYNTNVVPFNRRRLDWLFDQIWGLNVYRVLNTSKEHYAFVEKRRIENPIQAAERTYLEEKLKGVNTIPYFRNILIVISQNSPEETLKMNLVNTADIENYNKRFYENFEVVKLIN